MMYAEQMRKCTRCNNLKSESAFYNYTHEQRCKPCISEVRKLKYAEDRAGNAAKKRKYTQANPDKIKDIKLKQTYGIGLEDYNHMLAQQNGVCAICKRPETAVWRGKTLRLAVDHKENPHQVRGLLCMKCNRSFGLLEENIDFMLAMIEYAKKYLKLG